LIAVPDFDIRKWLNTDLAENIIYVINGVEHPIRALVNRYDGEQMAIQSVDNAPIIYPIDIEVSLDDVTTVSTGKVNGNTVTLRDIEGVTKTFSVMRILKFDSLSRSYKLGLA